MCAVGQHGTLSDQDAAGLKWWTSEVQWEIIDRCLQMHGGYGYINEYEVARLWRDSRVQRLLRGHHRDHEGSDGSCHGLLAMSLVTHRPCMPGSRRCSVNLAKDS